MAFKNNKLLASGIFALVSIIGVQTYALLKYSKLQNLVNEFPKRAVESWISESSNYLSLHELLRQGKTQEAREFVESNLEDSISNGRSYELGIKGMEELPEPYKEKAREIINKQIEAIQQRFLPGQ